ncbi:hypothetical protein FIBSPDRAFT_946276 [Athelia psychrophila]|uniref:Uncharacterized protein n=1 Tax=Athelia psychrophila TaxID=1759441 RepID=A0A166T4B7_9AGAM|nr:hypothetical protein FIBSPDRAFT_946276 [Fibularhizoctonia sp. CBS 109695]
MWEKKDRDERPAPFGRLRSSRVSDHDCDCGLSEPRLIVGTARPPGVGAERQGAEGAQTRLSETSGGRGRGVGLRLLGVGHAAEDVGALATVVVYTAASAAHGHAAPVPASAGPDARHGETARVATVAAGRARRPPRLIARTPIQSRKRLDGAGVSHVASYGAERQVVVGGAAQVARLRGAPHLAGPERR